MEGLPGRQAIIVTGSQADEPRTTGRSSRTLRPARIAVTEHRETEKTNPIAHLTMRDGFASPLQR